MYVCTTTLSAIQSRRTSNAEADNSSLRRGVWAGATEYRRQISHRTLYGTAAKPPRPSPERIQSRFEPPKPPCREIARCCREFALAAKVLQSKCLLAHSQSSASRSCRVPTGQTHSLSAANRPGVEKLSGAAIGDRGRKGRCDSHRAPTLVSEGGGSLSFPAVITDVGPTACALGLTLPHLHLRYMITPGMQLWRGRLGTRWWQSHCMEQTTP